MPTLSTWTPFWSSKQLTAAGRRGTWLTRPRTRRTRGKCRTSTWTRWTCWWASSWGRRRSARTRWWSRTEWCWSVRWSKRQQKQQHVLDPFRRFRRRSRPRKNYFSAATSFEYSRSDLSKKLGEEVTVRTIDQCPGTRLKNGVSRVSQTNPNQQDKPQKSVQAIGQRTHYVKGAVCPPTALRGFIFWEDQWDKVIILPCQNSDWWENKWRPQRVD